MNPNTMASGHSNTEKDNDLLINNVNNTKTVWNKYGDGGNSQTTVHSGPHRGETGTSSNCFYYTDTELTPS